MGSIILVSPAAAEKYVVVLHQLTTKIPNMKNVTFSFIIVPIRLCYFLLCR